MGKIKLAEIISIVSVVGSLVFVGFQLNQTRLLTRADMGADSMEIMAAFDADMSHPELAAVFAKMIDDPDSLSFEERIRVNSRLNQVVNFWIREEYLRRLSVFEESHEIADHYAALVFGNRYAQDWWTNNRARFLDYQEYLETNIRAVQPGDSVELYGSVTL